MWLIWRCETRKINFNPWRITAWIISVSLNSVLILVSRLQLSARFFLLVSKSSWKQTLAQCHAFNSIEQDAIQIWRGDREMWIKGLAQNKTNLVINLKITPSKALKHSPVLRKEGENLLWFTSWGIQDLFYFQCLSLSPNSPWHPDLFSHSVHMAYFVFILLQMLYLKLR